MLQVAALLAPLSGMEFRSSPLKTGNVHKRAEVSTTLRAPWDINWENVVDNIRLSYFSKIKTGPTIHNLLLNYDKNANRWNFKDASMKADLASLSNVRIGYELKRNFVQKLTSLHLRLSSPEVSGCTVVAEFDTLQREVSSLSPSIGLKLGERCKLLGKTEWLVGAKSMKHVARLQLLTRKLYDADGTEVGIMPLELRGSISHKLDEDEKDLAYEIALEQELGYMKGVGAKLDVQAKELVIEGWRAEAVGNEHDRVMTAAVAMPYRKEGGALRFDQPSLRFKRNHLLF